jgi:glycerophosphoryl diester phosphodiesterase
VAFSFDPSALRHIREELPGMPLGWTTWLQFPIAHAVAGAAHLDVQMVAVHAGSLWPNAATPPADVPQLRQVVARVHDADRQLVVWCPTESQSQSCSAAGVDALVVDDVPRLVRTLSRPS